ncbi:MAG: phosphoribosylglycinamide formyltransferase [Thermoplasmata archaeon]
MKLAVLASGEGTNLQAIIDSINIGYLKNVTISYVVSDKADARAVKRAKDNNISVIIINKKDMVDKLRIVFREVDLVVLAGFLKIIPPELIGGKLIINLHPSLLPLFGGKGMYGLKVHEEVIKSGMKVSGCTVHIVTESIDNGPIIIQKCIDVRDDDTPESLQERIHELEHEAMVEAIKKLEENNYKIVNNKIIFN